MVVTKGLKPNRQFKLLGERVSRLCENQPTIRVIQEQLNQTENAPIPLVSQGVNQPDSPVASHLSGTSISVTKSHHSSPSQVVLSRRQGSKGKKHFFQQ
ncbi:hypothetical protein O181_065571 [Austropuccinia psidii MF-1]|uniref:Uncharacterized protein n=1 Tax=Austropuccinia psidii MF-1 TaxID=1389203 RepID=A0A9Q3EP80_9BASI|nr:hypothetical protein [Austropuccinia psidii MF-1]